MITAIRLKNKLTLEDFINLPETEPASEFINEEITQKSMPQGKHSRLQGKLYQAINQVAEAEKIAYAFPELRCTFGGVSIVPDVVVYRWQRIPLDSSGQIANRFEIHPDWAIEILSPEQNVTQVLRKLLHCSRHGTELGWLINPEDESILVVFTGQKIDLYQGGTPLPILTEIELELTVETIFSWLRLNN